MAPTVEELLAIIAQKDKDLEKKDKDLEAEKAKTEPLLLEPYLAACHSLSLGINVNRGGSTTKGAATDPKDRKYPRRIVPWAGFSEEQDKIWDLLSDAFASSPPRFESQHFMDRIAQRIHVISAEQELRQFEVITVEDPVELIIRAACNNEEVQRHFGELGQITFQSHTNVSDPPTGAPKPPHTPPRKRQRVSHGNGTADQFCMCKVDGAVEVPMLAIEYKAPHKLSAEQVVTGLASEIRTKEDVISQAGGTAAFEAKWLCAAVVTQLFSYMVHKSIRYGYVCTGEAYVFVHIENDASTVSYHVSVPNDDVDVDAPNNLRKTAVAQIAAFTLQAMRSGGTLPPQWSDLVDQLETWKVEYDEILSKTSTARDKKKPRDWAYKAQAWKGRGVQRSAVKTRSKTRSKTGCQPLDATVLPDDDDDDDDDDENDTGDSGNLLLSPTPNRPSPGSRSLAVQTQAASSGSGSGRQQTMKERPYCTHQCLLGLMDGGAVDPACPNAAAHGPQHMRYKQFLSDLHYQLATDRDVDTSCVPLFFRGLIGGLFKVRLIGKDYTFVAKGVETVNREFLADERKVYDRLRRVQGEHVPACLGMLDLALPYYADGGRFLHFLLLGWAGLPMHRCSHLVSEADATPAVTSAFAAIHRLGVLHGDAEPRNVVVDEATGKTMVIDFDQAQILPQAPQSPPPLSSISPSSARKRKRSVEKGVASMRKGGVDQEERYASEMRHIKQELARCYKR